MFFEKSLSSFGQNAALWRFAGEYENKNVSKQQFFIEIYEATLQNSNFIRWHRNCLKFFNEHIFNSIW